MCIVWPAPEFVRGPDAVRRAGTVASGVTPRSLRETVAMKEPDMSLTARPGDRAWPSGWVRVSRDRAEPPGRAGSRRMAPRAGGAVMTDTSEPDTIRIPIADHQRVVRERLSMLVTLLGEFLAALPWF